MSSLIASSLARVSPTAAVALTLAAAGLGPVAVAAASPIVPAVPRAADAATVTTPDAPTLAGRHANALVRVAYTLRYDKGEAPDAEGWGFRNDVSFIVDQERTADHAGYLVGERTVIAPDPLIHPRYVDSIRVHLGDTSVLARPAAWSVDHPAVMLELAEPLPEGTPLAFTGSGTPARALTHGRDDSGPWVTRVHAFAAGTVTVGVDGHGHSAVPDDALLLDASGAPIGLAMSGRRRVDGSQDDPADWAMLDASDYDARMLSEWQPTMHGLVRRAVLDLRSPRQGEADMMYGYGYGDESSSQIETLAVLIAPDLALVLRDMRHDVTARLERITLHDVDGGSVEATFAGSLEDWGALVARLPEPVAVPVASDRAVLDLRHELLPATEVRLLGEELVFYPRHARVTRFERGWRDMVHPSGSYIASVGLVLDRDGRLLTLPIARRRAADQTSDWDTPNVRPTPAAMFATLVTDLDANIDPSNVPLSEEDEARVAWLGVELQMLDADLARLNDVSDITMDGMTGGMVTWVYDDSPAAAAGLEVGDIVVRLHVPDLPRPLDVEVAEDMFGGMFPWEMLDEVPEEMFDRIPQPWPSVESGVNKTLTSVGFGNEVDLEYARGGELERVTIPVVESPRHYGTAAREELESIGLTVRDVTFEARRYFRLNPEDGAVIVSKVEPGGRASVAGLKPYELITEIDGEAVTDVADFVERLESADEVRLGVRRMTRSRVVPVRVGD